MEVNLKIKTIIQKHPNWLLQLKRTTPLELILKGSLENNFSDILEIIQEIKDLFHDNIEISINKENTYIVTITSALKKRKYNRMYTSGCFDIFHYGHLNIIEKSKALCDFLIVGVSTDELILQEKKKLPVIPFEERMKIVSAIKHVDMVIPQVDKNKQKIVDEYNIDAISVGDDWKGRFPKTSCNVEYFSYTKNVSSTILKETLNINKS